LDNLIEVNWQQEEPDAISAEGAIHGLGGMVATGAPAGLHPLIKYFSNRRFDRSAPSSVSITDFALDTGS
jgi:hypothetical protein